MSSGEQQFGQLKHLNLFLCNESSVRSHKLIGVHLKNTNDCTGPMQLEKRDICTVMLALNRRVRKAMDHPRRPATEKLLT